MAVAILGGLIVATALTLLTMTAAWFRVKRDAHRQAKMHALPNRLKGPAGPFLIPSRGWRNW